MVIVDYNMFLKTKNKFLKRNINMVYLESVMPIHNIW